MRSAGGVSALKTLVLCVVATVLACGTALAQPAQTPAKSETPAKHQPLVCLSTSNIDRTRTPDTQTILFYMRNGKIWKNTLRARCSGLAFHGFIYRVRGGQICSNMQSIQVIQTHEICTLGDFTPYTPPKDKKSEKPK